MEKPRRGLLREPLRKDWANPPGPTNYEVHFDHVSAPATIHSGVRPSLARPSLPNWLKLILPAPPRGGRPAEGLDGSAACPYPVERTQRHQDIRRRSALIRFG